MTTPTRSVRWRFFARAIQLCARLLFLLLGIGLALRAILEIVVAAAAVGAAFRRRFGVEHRGHSQECTKSFPVAAIRDAPAAAGSANAPILLELLLFHAIPDGKPLHTFPGIASLSRNSRRKTAAHFSWNCFSFTQFQTENRCTLFLELLLSHAIPDGKPLHTFPGIALRSSPLARRAPS
ncbi:hypothetical protein EN751_20945 [Mesorhizobium sp. M4A.F.Ca.ET.029.04.2.1]|nr:hypothetical protein EN751_20945 [Mesorhizobium sp. M4A.F.Ca.ET.029.04.2.1]